VLISLALAVTLLFLLFARDISRSAHGATAPRRSEDRSFGALANSLIKSENQFDGRLDRLLSEGGTLRRYVFAARLTQLDQELPGWAITSDQLRSPTLAHNVDQTLADLTQERVNAYESLFRDIAHSLRLPWTQIPGQIVAKPSTSLLDTSQLWARARFSLVREPGDVHLTKTSTKSATYFAANGLSALVHSPTLALHRAVGIAAFRVSPAPLPANAGDLLLPPVHSVRLGISVVNASYDNQPVTLSIRVTPLNGKGKPLVQSMTTTLGPLRAYAFVPNVLKTRPSEQARVVLTLSGAPAGANMVTKETYFLEMSP
jgi:hypothetical protein